MTVISQELRRAIEEGGGQPTHIVDPETNAAYVLLRAEQFEQFQALLTEGGNVRDHYASVDRVFGEAGWDDPEMDLYDDYDANKR